MNPTKWCLVALVAYYSFSVVVYYLYLRLSETEQESHSEYWISILFMPVVAPFVWPWMIGDVCGMIWKRFRVARFCKERLLKEGVIPCTK